MIKPSAVGAMVLIRGDGMARLLFRPSNISRMEVARRLRGKGKGGLSGSPVDLHTQARQARVLWATRSFHAQAGRDPCREARR